MSLNCNEINVILGELDLTGAFVQEIVQPGFNMLALYTYKEGTARTVLVCTAQGATRLNETRRKITKNDKPLRFMEFLRAHIKGCRINSCAQLGLERIVKLELSRTVEENTKSNNQRYVHISLVKKPVSPKDAAQTEDSAPAEVIENYTLYLKLWSNAANVILCDSENTILESMFRRPERHEVKGEKFIPPEPKVQDNTAGSKTTYPVREWQQDEEHRTFNSYIDWWYGEQASELSKTSLLEKAEKWYNTRRSKMQSRLENLKNKQNDFENAEQLKHQGDLVLSYAHLIKPDSRFLECEDYKTGSTLRILIDPKKSAQENAQEYYKNYKKALSGKEELANDIEIAKKQIEKLDALYTEIKNEQNPVKIEQLLRRDSAPEQKKKKQHPGLDYTDNGWYILVGRDANENDELLRHHVRGDDLWMHVRDFPGGYVFIKSQKGKTVPLEILIDAANLAVHYSKARTNSKVDLYYTHVKYLRRAKNGPKGLVIPTQEKNLCITPDKKVISKLEMTRN